jgi:SAM-dependent methyltransferase
MADELARTEPETVLDLGCGWGEQLLRVLAAAPAAVGVGIDNDAAGIARGRANAQARGLSGRATFTVGAAEDHAVPADVVLCIGSAYAFGELPAAMRALRALVNPGGRLVLGESFWRRRPAEEELSHMWEGAEEGELTDLAGLIEVATGVGFRPLRLEEASQDEWDAFESGYLADWETWLIDYGHFAGAGEVEAVRTKADEHRHRWLRGYRDVMGFAYVTLAVPTSGA